MAQGDKESDAPPPKPAGGRKSPFGVFLTQPVLAMMLLALIVAVPVAAGGVLSGLPSGGGNASPKPPEAAPSPSGPTVEGYRQDVEDTCAAYLREFAALQGLEGAEPITRLVAMQRTFKSFVTRFKSIQPPESLAENHESAYRALRRVDGLRDSWIDGMQSLPTVEQQLAYLNHLDTSQETALMTEFRQRVRDIGAESCDHVSVWAGAGARNEDPSV